MLLLLYNISTRFYFIFIRFASLFNDKARKWVVGRKGIFLLIEQQLKTKTKKRVWAHCASLGEFEQIVPLLEKTDRKEYEIIITFFSPSGYELRKNHTLADYIFYLPADGSFNAKRFASLVQPDVALFVKYELWYYYLKTLHKNNIPAYLVSAVFEPKHIFFKWYGGLHRRMLGFFTQIFVINASSAHLLNSIGITNATITGDNRCDTVIHNLDKLKSIPEAEQFKGNSKLLIGGSTWPEEEELLATVYPAFEENLKIIIAPHDVSQSHIEAIEKKFSGKTTRFSQFTKQYSLEKRVLIIDNIGMLSSLYAYGDIALVGGGFRRGLHNIFEAAVHGLPVIYGPNLDKYPEGKDLAAAGGGFIVSNAEELKHTLSNLLDNEGFLKAASNQARKFIYTNRGATDKVFKEIFRK